LEALVDLLVAASPLRASNPVQGILLRVSDTRPHSGTNLFGTAVGVYSPPLHRSSSRQTVPSTALTSRPALFPTTPLPCRLVPTCLVPFLSLYFAPVDLLVAESPLRASMSAQGTPVRILLMASSVQRSSISFRYSIPFLSLYFTPVGLLVAESSLRASIPAQGTPVRVLLMASSVSTYITLFLQSCNSIPFIVFYAGRSARSRVVPWRQSPCPGHTRTCAPDGELRFNVHYTILSVIHFHSFHCILRLSICS
jgi:hypothetical protein